MDRSHIQPSFIGESEAENGSAAGTTAPSHRTEVRGREPNSHLDQEAIQLEKLRSYKNSRAGYLSWLTKLYGETEKLMTVFDTGIRASRGENFPASSKFIALYSRVLRRMKKGKDLMSPSRSKLVERRQNFMVRLDSSSECS